MAMPPPKHLAGPRARLDSHRDDPTLVGLAPPVERRPDPVNPPPPESVRPPMPSVETGQIVLEKGGWKLSLPGAFMLALLASLGGGVVSWLSKPSSGDAAPLIATAIGKMDAAEEKRAAFEKAITDRQGNVELELRLQRQSIENIRDLMNMRNPLPPSPIDPRAPAMNDALKK
jgi:hypothetical protein